MVLLATDAHVLEKMHGVWEHPAACWCATPSETQTVVSAWKVQLVTEGVYFANVLQNVLQKLWCCEQICVSLHVCPFVNTLAHWKAVVVWAVCKWQALVNNASLCELFWLWDFLVSLERELKFSYLGVCYHWCMIGRLSGCFPYRSV